MANPSRTASDTAHRTRAPYVVVAVGAAGLALFGLWVSAVQSQTVAEVNPPLPAATVPAVSCLGILEPQSEIVCLSAPSTAEAARVEQVLVKEGDWVEAGDVLATLDTMSRHEAALQEAVALVAVAESRREQVKAGSKPGEIAALEADVLRAEANHANAKREHDRAGPLLGKNVLTSQEFEKLRHHFDTTQCEVARAQGLLASARDVRHVDVRQTEAEVCSALAAVERFRADLESARVHAPFAGRILNVVAHPGERVGERGIVELGDTSTMHVLAEVYEADVGRVQVGQSARVRVPSQNLELQGQVVEVGHRVGRKVVLDNDPVADTDARVVEVRIRLNPESGKRVERLSNARVHVVIETRGE